jgi:predicted dehydrogenase
MYRAAIIGCGKIGSEFADDPRVPGIYSHAGAYSACDRTELVAICDADSARLSRCGNRWNIAARYQNPLDMLRQEEPDIVSICTPDETHARLVSLALQASGVRAVLAEKPLALSVQEARNLTQLADSRGICLAVNYSRRFAPSFRKVREFIKAGRIGAIQKVGGYYTKGVSHNGTHWFDLARFLIGEVVGVEAWSDSTKDDPDPTLDVRLDFDCGARGGLLGCDASRFTIFEMDLVGASGRVRLLESGHVFETYSVGQSPFYTGYQNLVRSDELQGGLQDVLLHAVENIVRCLDEGIAPMCTGRDGLAALTIAVAAQDSARLGRPVKVEGI